MEGRRATDKSYNNKFKVGSVGGLERAFCSYQLKANLKNNSDCLFGPTIGQRHKSPSNGPSASYPVAFRAGHSDLRIPVFWVSPYPNP